MIETSRPYIDVELRTKTDRGTFEQKPIGIERAFTANGPCINLLFNPVGGPVNGHEMKMNLPDEETDWAELPFDVVKRNYFSPTFRRRVWATTISEVHFIPHGCPHA